MKSFNNRIDAQRTILQIVNRRGAQVEELSGLSSKAIRRWMLANQIEATSHLAELIRDAGRALFFLANKSQEQITDEYELHSQEVVSITKEVEIEIQSLASAAF